jgi:hypothetical protein
MVEMEKILYWFDASGRRHLGANPDLINADNIWGDCSHLYGDARLVSGKVTSRHRGHIGNLSGDLTAVSGEFTGLVGEISQALTGDVSGLTGLVTGMIGKSTGLRMCLDFIDSSDRFRHPRLQDWL